MRLLLFLIIAVGLLSGCDSSDNPTIDAGPDAEVLVGTLEVVSDSIVAVQFGAQAEVVFRYREGGSPVAGVEVRLALEGRAHDSTIDDVSPLTDAEGVVRTTVTGGSVPAVFRLRASAEEALPVRAEISVGNLGFGSLVVEPAYVGERLGATRTVRVWPGLSCGATPEEADRSATLSAGQTSVTLNSLPAGIEYAVRADLFAQSTTAIASGCVDEITVSRVTGEEVRVELIDLPVEVEGEYNLSLVLRSESIVDRSEFVILEVAAEVAGEYDGAPLYLDQLDGHLREEGNEVEADALAADRLDESPEMALSERFAVSETGPITAVAGFVRDDVGAFLDEIALLGTLDLDLSSPALSFSAIRAGRLGTPDLPPHEFDPAMTPMTLSPSLAVSEIANDTLSVELTTALPHRQLLGQVIALEVERRITGPVGPLLADAAGCDEFGTWLSTETSLSGACPSECVQEVCLEALSQLYEAILLSLSATVETPEALTLQGSIEVADTEGDLTADALSGLGLAGTWLETESTDTEADFVADRVVETP